MKQLRKIQVIKPITLVAFGLLSFLSACKNTVPLLQQTTTKDSTYIAAEITRDSSSHVETLTEKKLEGATVGFTLTRQQWDSMLYALNHLPPNTPIYIQDPALRAQMRFFKDSLGRYRAECQAMDRTYYERHIKETHLRQTLQKELTRVLHEKELLKTELREAKKNFWDRIKATTDNLLLNACLVIIAAGLTVLLLRSTLGKIPFLKRFIP